MCKGWHRDYTGDLKEVSRILQRRLIFNGFSQVHYMNNNCQIKPDISLSTFHTSENGYKVFR